MFLGEDTFIYDSDYAHWKELNEPKDLQFEADFSAVNDSRKRQA